MRISWRWYVLSVFFSTTHVFKMHACIVFGGIYLVYYAYHLSESLYV